MPSKNTNNHKHTFGGKLSAVLLATLLLFTSCGTPQPKAASAADSSQVSLESTAESSAPAETASPTSAAKEPKYIFFFIGDGMGFPQVSAASIYRGTMDNNFTGTMDEPTPDNPPQWPTLNFMEFPVAGVVTTYDASKYITDSAPAATAMATGVKTLHGSIGVDTSNNEVPNLCEILREQKPDMKIGILTSVSIDHATPAAFYAHTYGRSNYYGIAEQLVESGFDYFGGGGFQYPTGKEKDQPDIHEIAVEKGYTVARTKAEFDALNKDSGKVIAVNENLDYSSDLMYKIDREDGDLGLSDFVKKGIELLDNDNGFFMLVEGGKIDWAGHANDAYTNMLETMELELAVQEAIDFYNQHPDETLILVTGDHETGGMSLGSMWTCSDTYFKYLSNQKISYLHFRKEYLDKYLEEQTPFEEAMKDVKELFGLVLPDDPDAGKEGYITLNDYDIEQLHFGYEYVLTPKDQWVKDDKFATVMADPLYSDEPFQLIVTRILNYKSGIGWTSSSHTAMPVGIYAVGPGSEEFDGFFDNTDIFHKLKGLLSLS